jgi:proline dehydrogenase
MKLPFFLASRFVAGETLDESLPVVDELNREGLHVALDKLGEHVRDRSRALAARDKTNLIRSIPRPPSYKQKNFPYHLV